MPVPDSIMEKVAEKLLDHLDFDRIAKECASAIEDAVKDEILKGIKKPVRAKAEPKQTKHKRIRTRRSRIAATTPY